MSRIFSVSSSSFALGIACGVGAVAPDSARGATLTVNAEARTAAITRLGQPFAVPNGVGESAIQRTFGGSVGPFAVARGEGQAIDAPGGIGVFANSSALYTCGEATCGDRVEEGFPQETLTLVRAEGEASARETFVNTGPTSDVTLDFALAPGSAALRDSRRSDPSLEPYKQVSTVGWLLDGAPIWSYTFGLESRGYDAIEIIAEVDGPGLFPEADCAIGEGEAECSVDAIAGTVVIGRIGAGESFDLTLFAFSRSILPPAEIDCTDAFVDCAGDVAFAGARLSDPGVPAFLEFTFTPVQAIPVPPTLPLAVTALAGLAAAGRRRR